MSSATLRTQRQRGDFSATGTASAVLDEVAANANSFRRSFADDPEADDKLMEAIEQADVSREQAYVAMDTLIRESSDDAKTADVIHRFIETLSSGWDYSPEGGGWVTRFDNDALHYLCHSVFVGFVAIGLRHRRFDLVERVLSQPLYRSHRGDRLGKGVDYGELRPYLEGLEEVRKRRLKLNRLSVHADHLHKSHEHSLVTFLEFMEADFTLYMRELLAAEGRASYPDWYPISLVYAFSSDGSFPTYVRATSKSFYDRFKVLLAQLGPDDLRSALEPYTTGRKPTVKMDYRSVPVGRLANLNDLGTKS